MTRSRLARLALSGGLLALLVALVGPRALFERLAAADPAWLALALALTVLQVIASAWRWRFTARRLGLDLPLGVAVREYYLATLANQLLPGGVLGDVGRAGRHARASGETGAAVRAVVLERAAGQAAFVPLAAAALLAGPLAVSAPVWVVAGALGALVAGGAMVHRAARRRPGGFWARFAADACRALFARTAWPVQLAASLAIALSYVAVFALAGVALGMPAPATWLPLVPLVLLAMLIPGSAGGWGLREGGAAAAWAAAGLAPADGVALAMVYGAIVLAGSLPGLAFAARAPAGSGRGRGAGAQVEVEQDVVAEQEVAGRRA